MRYRGTRTGLGTYIAICAAMAAATLAITLTRAGGIDLGAVLIFGLLALLAETFAVTTAMGSTYSVTFVVTIAAATAIGPAGAILVALFGTTGLRDVRERTLGRHLFNAAQIVLSTSAAAYALHAIAGAGTSVSLSLLAVSVAAAINFLLNTGLVSAAIGLSSGLPAVSVWRERFLGLAPAYLAYAVLGLLLGILHGSVGWGSILFFLVPLIVARNAFRAAIDLQDSFDRVVTTLIAAVEQKDPYTRGHAERVSRLAERVARSYGKTPQEARAIRYAALMHDIGKLAVHNNVLRKPGSLTDNEHQHMRRHTEHGAELAADIELLSGVLDGIRHHHERWDGLGYPDRLAGEQIPEPARIITVSDAFDAMTSTRSYSKARSVEVALEELERCAGTQFDPKAVAALRRTVEAEGWTPPDEIADGDAHGGCDHDLPVHVPHSQEEHAHAH